MTSILQDAVNDLKAQKPLILNLTNLVTIEFVAAGLLALGAAPVMSEDQEDAADLLAAARALLINIGTLDEAFGRRALLTARVAAERNIPVVLDPVGAGAGRRRTELSHALLATGAVKVLKGNAGELAALAGAKDSSLGVESLLASREALEAAREISRDYKITVLVSGAVDLIVSPGNQAPWELPFGHELMTKVTGTGCLLGGLTAAFMAQSGQPEKAALMAAAYWGLTGESAALSPPGQAGPGSYRQALLDCLYHPDWHFINLRLESGPDCFS